MFVKKSMTNKSRTAWVSETAERNPSLLNTYALSPCPETRSRRKIGSSPTICWAPLLQPNHIVATMERNIRKADLSATQPISSPMSSGCTNKNAMFRTSERMILHWRVARSKNVLNWFTFSVSDDSRNVCVTCARGNGGTARAANEERRNATSQSLADLDEFASSP